MDDIKDLIKIVTEYTRKNIPLIDLKTPHSNGNKELNLFLGIKNNVFSNDAEASQGIYGSPEVDFKFRMLKSRLNRKLLNHLFFIDYSILKLPKSEILRQECHDYLCFSRSLLKAGEKKLAAKLLNKAVEIAKECEFTDLAIEGLKELRNIYATLYRPKLFQNIKRQLEEAKSRFEEEEQSSDEFYKAKLRLNSTINNRKKDLGFLIKTIDSLREKTRRIPSFNIYEKYLKLKLLHFELEGDFDGLLRYSEQLEQEFRLGHFNENRFDSSVIWMAKLKAFLKLNRLMEGITLAEQKLINIDTEDRLWLNTSEYLFLMLMQSKDFNRAGIVLQNILECKAPHYNDENQRIKWNVYLGYTYYLTGNNSLINNFDYQSFITKTPEYKKERAGIHTAILFLQVLSHLDGNMDLLNKKLDAIDDYTVKYLNNSFSKRTKIFHKLLQKVVAHNSTSENLMVKSKYLEDKLKETGVTPTVYADLEVVSYEYLWECTLQKLLDIKASVPAKSKS